MEITSLCDLRGNTSSQIKTSANFGQVNRSKSNDRAEKPLSFQSGPPGSHEVSGSAQETGPRWPGLPASPITLLHIAPGQLKYAKAALPCIVIGDNFTQSPVGAA